MLEIAQRIAPGSTLEIIKQLAVALTTVIIVALTAAMLVLSGPVAEAVGGAIGLGGVFLTAWNIIKWPVIVMLVVAVIASCTTRPLT